MGPLAQCCAAVQDQANDLEAMATKAKDKATSLRESGIDDIGSLRETSKGLADQANEAKDQANKYKDLAFEHMTDE